MIVDINKIIFSLFFAFLCGLTTIILQSKFSYIVLVIFCVVFLLYFGFLRLYYKNDKMGALTAVFFITVVLIDIFAKPHIKDIAGSIIFAFGYLFLFLTVYYIISYESAAKIFVNKKSKYIIQDNFNYSFIPVIIFTVIYSITGYFLAFDAKELGFELSLTLYLAFSYILLMLFMWKLFKYKYAFKLLSLLDNKEIPYKDIDLLQQGNTVQFVEKYIYPYIKNVQFYGDKFIVSNILYPKPA